jgi:membrane fusion protein, copper/silver efflux system
MNPTSRRLRLVLLPLLAAFALVLPLVGCGGEHGDEHGDTAGWHCPMHPTYTSDGPGDCPICGMRLVPIDQPGQSAAAGHEGHDHAAGVDGFGTVETTADGVRLAGVRTATATRERLATDTRTVGVVVPDERRIRHVHTKIAGWVEKLHVDTTGELVRAGQPILALYSPELLASQEELLRAREAAGRFADSSIPEVRRGGEELVTAARRRLELYDVPASFIANLERTGRTQRAVTLVAPASGFVTTKSVFEGQEVQPGMELFTLTDLSHVWVEADFYEYEARLLRVGQRAEVHLPYEAGAVREGEITFVYPTMQAESRTVKVRLELPNRDGLLRPGSYVDVVAHLDSADGVTVPADAVLDSGLRQVVFVETAPGVFEPREVRVGQRGDGRALLLSGLAEGERVATRANFLLDSESRLRAALAGAGPLQAGAVGTPAPPPAAHQH